MGRLVDVDGVVKAVDKHTKDESEIVLDDDITCILEEVPTAYDVEKVVADLEQLKIETKTKNYRIDWALEVAIDIVKSNLI